jgi:hypothetical protein
MAEENKRDGQALAEDDLKSAKAENTKSLANPAHELPSKDEALFVPSRNWLGKDHKEKGVYITDDEVIFYKSEGYKGRSVKFNIDSIASLSHLRKFTFMFLIVLYSFKMIHSIAFITEDGKLLASMPIRSFTKKNLKKILNAIEERSGGVSMDPAVSNLAENGRMGKFSWNLFLAIAKGMIPWVLLAFVFIIIGVLAN